MQVSINGSWWFGLQRSPPINIRTMYEDCEKGSEMQCSTVFDNFYQRVMSEGNVPEEFFIGADNTPKETKKKQHHALLPYVAVGGVGRHPTLEHSAFVLACWPYTQSG